jgi:hypothetical protein
MVRWFVLPLMLSAALAVASEPVAQEQELDTTQRIYRTVDAQGRPVFTDAPDPGRPTEEVQVREQNTIPMARPKPLSVPQKESVAVVYKLAITSPEDQSTVHNPESISVQISVAPAPGEGHRLRLLDNGVESPRTIAWPDRGEHRFVAQVVNARGEVLAESAPVVLYVQRARVKK